MRIDSGKTLEADTAVGSGQRVPFEGSDTLVLGDAHEFAAMLSSFDSTDRLDLTEFSAVTSLSFSENSSNIGGTLTVADGSLLARIALIGSYSNAGFHSAGDGHSGSFISVRRQARRRSPLTLSTRPAGAPPSSRIGSDGALGA